MLTCLHLISRDFQSKRVGPIQTERKIATFEAEKDNTSQTATHIKQSHLLYLHSYKSHMNATLVSNTL